MLTTLVNFVFIGAAFSILVGMVALFNDLKKCVAEYQKAIELELTALDNLNRKLTAVAQQAINQNGGEA